MSTIEDILLINRVLFHHGERKKIIPAKFVTSFVKFRESAVFGNIWLTAVSTIPIKGSRVHKRNGTNPYYMI